MPAILRSYCPRLSAYAFQGAPMIHRDLGLRARVAALAAAALLSTTFAAAPAHAVDTGHSAPSLNLPARSGSTLAALAAGGGCGCN